MPLAKPIWKVPMCNRRCEPLLKCPPGSHVSASHKSCIWHGRNNQEEEEKPGLLSSIVNSLTGNTPASTPTQSTTPSLFSAPAANIFQREPVTETEDYDSFLRNRAANSESEFGGGARRHSLHRLRKALSKSRQRKSKKRSALKKRSVRKVKKSKVGKQRKSASHRKRSSVKKVRKVRK